MADTDKRKLTTFQQIIENNPESIYAQTDGLLRERHGGLTIKFEKNEVANNSSILEEVIQTESDEVTNSNNNLKEDAYNAVTIFSDEKKKIKKLISEQINASKKINSQKVNNNKILRINSEIEKEENKLKRIKESLKNSQLIGKKKGNKLKREVVKCQHKIEEMNNDLSKLNQEKKELDKYLKENDNVQKILTDNIEKLLKNKKINNTKILTKNRKKIRTLKKEHSKINNLQKELKYEKKILQLENEIKQEKSKNDQKVTKMYEEILVINNETYFITTFVHANQSITEKVMFFHNFGNNNVEILTQTKKYKNINAYKKETMLINRNIKNKNVSFSKIPVKFLIKEHIELWLKPSNSEKIIWYVFTGVAVLAAIAGLIVLFPPIAIVPAIAIPIKIAAGILGAIRLSASFISSATKKVESWYSNKIKTLINKEQKDKNKEKEKSIIQDLTSEKLETKLKAQFKIFKQELENRKMKKVDELLSEKVISKTENHLNFKQINSNFHNFESLNLDKKESKDFDSSIKFSANQQSNSATTVKSHSNLNL